MISQQEKQQLQFALNCCRSHPQAYLLQNDGPGSNYMQKCTRPLSQTPPLLPQFNNNHRSPDSQLRISDMQQINYEYCHRQMNSEQYEKLLCYTDELRSHYLQAQKIVKNKRQVNSHRMNPKQHHRRASMDLNLLTKQNYISQTLPVNKKKKPKPNIQKNNTKRNHYKNNGFSSINFHKNAQRSTTYSKTKAKEGPKTSRKHKEEIKTIYSVAKHTRWFSDCLNPQNTGQEFKGKRKNKTTIKNYDRIQNQDNAGRIEKIMVSNNVMRMINNNSKASTLKSLDYSRFASSQITNHSIVEPQIEITVEQEEQVNKINEDSQKYLEQLSNFYKKNNEEDQSYNCTNQLVCEYITKTSKHRLFEPNSVQSYEITSQIQHMTNSNVSSEVISKIEVQKDQSLVHKISMMISQITELNKKKQQHSNIQEEKQGSQVQRQNYEQKQRQEYKEQQKQEQGQISQSNKSIQYQETFSLVEVINNLDLKLVEFQMKVRTQLAKISEDFYNGRLNQEQYAKEQWNIKKWYEIQSHQIQNAKKHLNEGLKVAVAAIDSKKKINSPHKFQQPFVNAKIKSKLEINKKLCKSMSYLKHKDDGLLKRIKSKQGQKGSKSRELMQLTKIQDEGSDDSCISDTSDKASSNIINEEQLEKEKYVYLDRNLQIKEIQYFDSDISEQNTSNEQKKLKQSASQESENSKDFSENNFQSDHKRNFQRRIKPLQSPPPKLQPSPSKKQNPQKANAEDIIQFLFLDLCLEIQEYYFRVISSSKGKGLGDNVLLRTRLKNALHSQNRKKGFNTNRKQIVNYLNNFKDFLQGQYYQQKQEKAKTNKIKAYFQKNILDNLNTPVGPSPSELLKFMRASNDPQIIDDFTDNRQQQTEDTQKLVHRTDDEPNNEATYVFDIQWFDEFSKLYIGQYDFGRYYVNEEKEEKRTMFLKNAMHIHNKMMFDCFNEAADRYRKHGLFGEPFPWKVSSNMPVTIQERELQKILIKIFRQVEDNSVILCGIMPDKQFSYNISEYEALQLRQDRLCKMLAKDLIEHEERWVFYDDEETELLVDIGQWTYGYMLGQAIEQMIHLSLKISYGSEEQIG